MKRSFINDVMALGGWGQRFCNDSTQAIYVQWKPFNEITGWW